MARVTILLGKGGTGRTTVARAMALNELAQGRPAALQHADPTTEQDAHVTEDAVEGLRVRVMDPYNIMADAMARLVPLGPLTRSLARHPAYQSFLEVAPGIKEAAVLNFLYGFLDRREDAVFLDAPATGHGLHFLEAPAKLARILTGKVAQRLDNVDAMVHDPAVCGVVLVSLPEELPAIETMELADALRAGGFPLRGLVVNRMPPPVPFDTGPPPERIEVPVDPGRDGWGSAGAIDASDAMALLAAQRREAERWLDELKGLDLPTRIVPSLPGRSRLAEEVARFLVGFPPDQAPGAGKEADP